MQFPMIIDMHAYLQFCSYIATPTLWLHTYMFTLQFDCYTKLVQVNFNPEVLDAILFFSTVAIQFKVQSFAGVNGRLVALSVDKTINLLYVAGAPILSWSDLQGYFTGIVCRVGPWATSLLPILKHRLTYSTFHTVAW